MSTQERVITIFSTKGKNKTKITTDATNWGQLKELIIGEGYDLANLAAVENKRRSTLENVQAELPEGDFTVFLRPVKTKSGLAVPEDASRSDLKDIITEFGTPLKEFLKTVKPGRNWTQLATVDLKAGIEAYNPGTEVAEEQVCEEEVVEESNPTKALIEAVNDAFETLETMAVETNNDKVVDIVSEMRADYYTKLCAAIEDDGEDDDLLEEWEEIEEGFE